MGPEHVDVAPLLRAFVETKTTATSIVMSTRRRKNTVVEILSKDGTSLVLDSDIEVEFIVFFTESYTPRVEVADFFQSLEIGI